MSELTLEVQKVKRIFKYNGKHLADPDPSMKADDVMDFYSLTYPEIASAKMVGPDLDEENGEMTYEFKTEIKTKG